MTTEDQHEATVRVLWWEEATMKAPCVFGHTPTMLTAAETRRVRTLIAERGWGGACRLLNSSYETLLNVRAGGRVTEATAAKLRAALERIEREEVRP